MSRKLRCLAFVLSLPVAPVHAHHSAALRFSLSDDRRHLRYAATVEDPEYLEAPIVNASDLDYRQDLQPTGLPCDLEVARMFLSEE